MKFAIVATVLGAALSAGMPARAQYVQYIPVPQEENVLSRLSAETVDAMQAINAPWYGERITHVARRILEFGQPAADVVTQTLYQVSAQNSQWAPAAQQVSLDVNRAIGEIQAQAATPATPLFQLFVGPGEHRRWGEEHRQQEEQPLREERHGQVPAQQQAPQYHQEPPQQNRQPSQPQSGGPSQPPQPPPVQAVPPKPVQQPSAPQGQAPQAGHERGQGHPCDDARDPNCREHH